MPSRKDKCPSCGSRKDVRSRECIQCSLKNNPRRLGTGAHGPRRYVTVAGYIEIVKVGERKLEHRDAMELNISRPLRSDEHVHHLNHDRSDNRIENLIIISASDHARLHISGRAHAMSRKGHAARWGK